MAVFATLMGLVFWGGLYLLCCSKNKYNEREQVKLLRYRHEAEDYKEVYDYIDKVSDYYYNVLGGDCDKIDQLVAHFPELNRHTLAPHSVYPKSSLAYWAADIKLMEIKERYKTRYKSAWQHYTQPFNMFSAAISIRDFSEEEYKRRQESDARSNAWVDQMRAKYFVSDPID